MAAELDAYRAADDDDVSSARSRRRAVKPWRKRMLSIFSVLFLVGMVVAVAIVIHKVKPSNKTNTTNDKTPTNVNQPNQSNTNTTNANTSVTNDANKTTKAACATRRPAPHTRTVVFWQSEVAGCEKIPSGVTHVVFGFALVDGVSGRVTPTFQSTDGQIQSCVQTLRSNCIASLGSIGGSTNAGALNNFTDDQTFAASAVALVTKFGFDGIDIDDETVGPAFNATRAVALVAATRAALSAKDKTLLLTYDAYFYDGQPSFCLDPAHLSYSRCFPPALLPSLDWVNIMAYNVAKNETEAANIYDQAINTTFASWRTELAGDFTKATIGVCVKQSCAFGDGPSAAVIAHWNAMARTDGSGGGMMVYAASSEVTNDFAITRSVLPHTS